MLVGRNMGVLDEQTYAKLMDMINWDWFSQWRQASMLNGIGTVQRISISSGTRDGLKPAHYELQDSVTIQVALNRAAPPFQSVRFCKFFRH